MSGYPDVYDEAGGCKTIATTFDIMDKTYWGNTVQTLSYISGRTWANSLVQESPLLNNCLDEGVPFFMLYKADTYTAAPGAAQTEPNGG